MKKILVTTMIAGAIAASALAQGTVGFTASSKIFYSEDGVTTAKVAAGNPATITTHGNFNIALYVAAQGTSLPAGFTSTTPVALPAATWTSSGVLHQMNAAGTMVNTFQLPAAGTFQAILLAWTGNAADWNTALSTATAQTLLGWSGSALSGGALTWVQATGAPNATPPTAPTPIVSGASGFSTMVLQPIPEPSTFALAGLGAAALLIFRRRK